MDKIIKITLGLFIVVLVAFAAIVSYNGFVERAYRTSLSSTYSYTCSITTDSQLNNVTFFLPVPADRSGNSPIVAQFSAREMSGVPYNWKVALYDTGKATMAKITTPAIIPPPGTSPSRPYTIRLSSDLKTTKVIDTANPNENSAMFRPVMNLEKVACPQDSTGAQGSPQCSTYLTSLYADYQAPPNATVNIKSTLAGKNSWKIFEPRTNEYHTEISLLMFGDNHGWVNAKGALTSGIGMYDAPSYPS